MVHPDDLLNFIELGSFVASWEELGLEDDDLAALQIGLMSDPRQGPLVKETGGLRKLRFSPSRLKKGKSGALRVGYIYLEKYGLIVLVLVYRKGEMDDIPAAKRKQFRAIIGRIEKQLERQYGSKRPAARAKSPVQKMMEGLTAFAESLEAGEDVREKFTARSIALKLQPSPVKPQTVKRARLSLGLSQALFAQLLGVSASTVQAWEQGKRQPDPMACRVLAGIRRDPGYWKKWFLELAESRLST